MISQGGVRLDGAQIGGDTVQRGELVGRVLQVGKRKFVRLV